MKTEGSLPYSQQSAANPCPEPDQFLTFQSKFLKIHLILSSHLRLGLPSCLLHSRLPTKSLYALLLYPMRATFLAKPILPDLINGKIFGDEYRP
jgi:hypothetical protein